MLVGMRSKTEYAQGENRRELEQLLSGVAAGDCNALEDLYDECAKKGIRVIFSHVNEQPLRAMRKAGFTALVGKENLCRNIDAAIERAEEIVSQPLPVKKEKKTEKKA